MTTNTVEGFHGLALMYRDKRTDLEHTHYVCKTNMAVCHKVRMLQQQLYYVHASTVESWSYLETSLPCKHGSRCAVISSS